MASAQCLEPEHTAGAHPRKPQNPHKTPQKWGTLHFFRWFMGQHHKATGQCQTIHPTKSEATRKQAAPNSVPQSPISGCGGCLTGLQCLRKLQYMPQQEDILHEEQTAHSQVTPEKQFPGFHLSITSVTVPFTTASTSVFTTSVADAVTKQRFSHPLLSFQEIKLFPFLRTLSSSSPGFTQLFSRWCNSFKSISTVPLKKTEKFSLDPSTSSLQTLKKPVISKEI